MCRSRALRPTIRPSFRDAWPTTPSGGPPPGGCVAVVVLGTIGLSHAKTFAARTPYGGEILGASERVSWPQRWLTATWALARWRALVSPRNGCPAAFNPTAMGLRAASWPGLVALFRLCIFAIPWESAPACSSPAPA